MDIVGGGPTAAEVRRRKANCESASQLKILNLSGANWVEQMEQRLPRTAQVYISIYSFIYLLIY